MLLALLPFLLIALVYVVGSAARHAANPDDKLLPLIGEMADDRGSGSPSSPTGGPASYCCGPTPRRASSGC